MHRSEVFAVKSRTLFRIATLVLAAAFLFALPAPALAVRGPVPNHAIVAGMDLYGMSEASARELIVASTAMPYMEPLQVMVEDRTFTFDPNTAMSVDVARMLNEAYSTARLGQTYEIPTRFKINSTRLAAFINSIKKAVDTPPRDATHYVNSKRLLSVRPSRNGLGIVYATAWQACTKALISQASAGGYAVAPVVLTKVTLYPRVTTAKVGKAILVRLGERRLRLYRSSTVLRTLGCAIGMPAYPTPTGTFKVVRKVKMPSWTNPGSDWASNMPAYIPPGPSNPLGTRALYLNAGGIRIHGTQKVGSIGAAASHGCVRLRRADVEWLYDYVPVGTKVFIIK